MLGRRIEGLGDRDERDGMLVEEFHQLWRSRRSEAGQPVDLVDDNDVDLPGPPHAIQKVCLEGGCDPGRRRTGPPSSYRVRTSPPSPRVPDSLCMPSQGLPFGPFERVELQVEVMLGGILRVVDPRQRAAFSGRRAGSLVGLPSESGVTF